MVPVLRMEGIETETELLRQIGKRIFFMDCHENTPEVCQLTSPKLIIFLRNSDEMT